MKAKYWQKGETLDYTPEEKVEYGAIVPVGMRIGIAASDIAAGEPGHIHVVGVFEMAKDAAEISLGAVVYYDAENDVVTATGGDIQAGYAVAAAAAADTTVLVKLLG